MNHKWRTRIAARVSDGDPVNWDAELGRHPEDRSWLERMRWLESNLVGPRHSGMDDPSPVDAVGVSWGSFEIRECLGRGAYGEVFRAFDPSLQIDVALKLWPAEWTSFRTEEDLLEEARLLARVRHPNVLKVLGAAVHEGRFGMWSELVEGETLETWIMRQGPLGPSEATLIGVELCRALAAVHGAGLVHRDVKCANVMREHGGRIVLMDFGIVIPVASLHPGERVVPRGTPLTAAPEQLAGEPPGPTSDLYALGVLLYRLVTCAYPVEADSVVELIHRHRHRERVLLRDRRPDLPLEFINVVEGAIAWEAFDRPATAGAFEKALLDSLKARADHPGDTHESLEPAPRRLHLPAPLTTFIGREAVVETCAGLLRERRLVTVLGPGGCGKTRLAIRLAGRWAETTGDMTWFVDLSGLTDGTDIGDEVCRVLRLRDSGRPMQSVAEYVAGHDALLVLDNCEHVLAASADVARTLLERAPALRILATSRHPLGVPGEQSFRVPPLDIPSAGSHPAPDALAACESAQLFLDRGRLADPSLKADSLTCDAIAAICRRLEGNPLAIELAAAKLRVLDLFELQGMLEENLVRLSSRSDEFVSRHRTLVEVFEWSYRLLDNEERRLLGALTVFAGSWRLESAAAVCAPEDPARALETHERLVEKSLVAIEPGRRGQRAYRLLDALREIAIERLGSGDSLRAMRRRHAHHYRAQSQSFSEGLASPDPMAWLERIEAEHDNLVAAIRWRDPEDSSSSLHGLHLATAIWRYWYTRGLFSLGRRLLSGALGLCQPWVERHHADALCASAYLATSQGDPAAAPLFEEALRLYARHGIPLGEARCLSGLGSVAVSAGDYGAARARFEMSLALQRPTGSNAALAVALNNLGAVTWRLGDYETSAALHREGLEHATRSGHREGATLNLVNLGWIAVRRGRPGEAASALAACLRHVRDLRARHRAAEALELAAETLALRDDWPRALRLSGAAESLRLEIGVPPEGVWQQASDAFRAAAVRQVGAMPYEAELAAGRGLDFEHATTLALECLAVSA